VELELVPNLDRPRLKQSWSRSLPAVPAYPRLVPAATPDLSLASVRSPSHSLARPPHDQIPAPPLAKATGRGSWH